MCGVQGNVTLATFKGLLDNLQQQKADIEDLLPASSIDIVRLNVTALKQALLPWPLKRLAELHQALPNLAAGRADWGAVQGCRVWNDSTTHGVLTVPIGPLNLAAWSPVTVVMYYGFVNLLAYQSGATYMACTCCRHAA